MRGQSCWSVDHNSRNEAVDVPFSTKQNSSGHQNVTFAMFSNDSRKTLTPIKHHQVDDKPRHKNCDFGLMKSF